MFMILMLEYLQDVIGVDLRGTIDVGLKLMVDGALANDRLALDRQPRLELLSLYIVFDDQGFLVFFVMVLIGLLLFVQAQLFQITFHYCLLGLKCPLHPRRGR